LLARAGAGLALYMAAPGDGAAQLLESDLAALEAMAGDGTRADFRPGLAGLSRHGREWLEQRRAVDELSAKIGALPLAPRARELALHYQGVRDGRTSFRAALFAGGGGLLVLLGYGGAVWMLWRERRRTAASEVARNELKATLKETRLEQAALRTDAQEDRGRLMEERHRALARHAFDVMAILSREENYIHVSPASESIYGLTEKEMIGKSVYEGIHADDIIKVQDYLTRAQRGLQMDQSIQYRVMDAYGKWHLVETHASNQASNPAIRGMVLNTRRLGPAAGGR